MKIAAALLLVLAAQDDSFDARLRKLEEQVESLQKENAQLRRDLGVAGSLSNATGLFGQVTKLSIGAKAFRTTDTNLALPSDFGVDSTPATPAKDNLFLGRRRALGLDAQYELGSFELWSAATRPTVSGSARLQTVF